MNKKLKSHLKQQRGIAMIVALLALVLLAAIGMALMFMADTENSVNNNYKDSQKAYFAARAGAEQARLLIGTDNTTKNAALGLAMPSSAANTGMLYLLNPTSGEAIDPTKVTGATLANNPYLDNQICWEQYTSLGLTPTAGPCTGGQLLPSSASFKTLTMLTSAGTGGAENVSTGAPVNAADALPFKWVRITNKQNFMGTSGQAGQQRCRERCASVLEWLERSADHGRHLLRPDSADDSGMGTHFPRSDRAFGKQPRLTTHRADGSGLRAAH